MEFESANQFRAAVTKYVVIKGVDVRLIRNESNRLRLKLLGEGIFEAIADYPLYSWCKASFYADSKCDVVDNNMCETFNGWILGARTKPIISMVDEIRKQVMKRNVAKQKSVEAWKGNVSPKAMEKVGKNELLSHDWSIDWNGEDAYEVTYVLNSAKRHIVDLSQRCCSCREWDLIGIPCPHAIACIQVAKREVSDYVSHCYSKETYMKSYAFSLKPMKGIDMLDDIGRGGCLPPPFRVMPGRPKRNRRKDPTEERKRKIGKSTRLGSIMKCSLCKDPSHNFRTCPKKKYNPQHVPPHRKRKARNQATTSSQSEVATPAPQHVQLPHIHRFKSSTEANLQAAISESIKFANEMSVPRSQSKKAKKQMTLTQLNKLKIMKRKDGGSSSQS
ncbi:hypothetical protein OROHE_004895 [Orobanche hederae]